MKFAIVVIIVAVMTAMGAWKVHKAAKDYIETCHQQISQIEEILKCD